MQFLIALITAVCNPPFISDPPCLPTFQFFDADILTKASRSRMSPTIARLHPGQRQPGQRRNYPQGFGEVFRIACRLEKYSVAQLVEICSRAGEHFLNGTLPLGGPGELQSPPQYIEALSATSGLPQVLVRRNMAKIHGALVNMKTILNGLTRGLDPAVLDGCAREQFGVRLSFYPATHCLGVVMPSNSPAVNSLWLPAIPLKIPVVIKPGREEPWTPFRLIQAFVAAGCPAEAFGFYPTDHEGAARFCAAVDAPWFSATKTPRPPTPTIPPFKFTGRVAVKFSSARTKSNAGLNSLISSPPPFPTTADAVASTCPSAACCLGCVPSTASALRMATSIS